MSEYKVYEDSSFISADSPVVLDIEADLSWATYGTITCDGAGDINISFSYDGTTYGDVVRIRNGEFSSYSSFLIKKIRLEHTGVDSSYRIIAGSFHSQIFRHSPEILRHQRVTSVQEYAAASATVDKINYVVAAGKNLFIEHWYVAVSEGKKNIFELHDDGVGVSAIGNGEAGTGGGSMTFPSKNPLDPIAAASVVRISKVSGQIGKDWACGFSGYLEDI